MPLELFTSRYWLRAIVGGYSQKAAKPAPKARWWCGSNMGRGHTGGTGGGGGGGQQGPGSDTSTSESLSSSPAARAATAATAAVGDSRCPYSRAKNARGDDGRGIVVSLSSLIVHPSY